MTKSADNLIPGGALDWEDVETCAKCEVQHCVDELTEIDGDLVCEDCEESKQ